MGKMIWHLTRVCAIGCMFWSGHGSKKYCLGMHMCVPLVACSAVHTVLRMLV